MKTVVIVDYGLCNIDSVRRAVEECGAVARISDKPVDLEDADQIVLPGVGAFPDAMRNLRAGGLDQEMREAVFGRGVPFLGICLGMQLLMGHSWEGGNTEGLGWIPGEVRRLEPGARGRVPHVGWNTVILERESPLFRGVGSHHDFYFVHSYGVQTADDRAVVARTSYGDAWFVSAVQSGSIFGVQFHPEKSQRLGLTVIRNFLGIDG
jgi:glutamine amidotransferase